MFIKAFPSIQPDKRIRNHGATKRRSEETTKRRNEETKEGRREEDEKRRKFQINDLKAPKQCETKICNL
jgi:hypothetical protein